MREIKFRVWDGKQKEFVKHIDAYSPHFFKVAIGTRDGSKWLEVWKTCRRAAKGAFCVIECDLSGRLNMQRSMATKEPCFPGKVEAMAAKKPRWYI